MEEEGTIVEGAVIVTADALTSDRGAPRELIESLSNVVGKLNEYYQYFSRKQKK